MQWSTRGKRKGGAAKAKERQQRAMFRSFACLLAINPDFHSPMLEFGFAWIQNLPFSQRHEPVRYGHAIIKSPWRKKEGEKCKTLVKGIEDPTGSPRMHDA